MKVQINFTYANKKNAAIHAPMYTKQSSAQKKCMQISCTEFYPNPKMNVNIREALHFSSQSKAWLSLYRFIPNSKLFFTFLSAFLEPNFFPNLREDLGKKYKISLTLSGKVEFTLHQF